MRSLSYPPDTLEIRQPSKANRARANVCYGLAFVILHPAFIHSHLLLDPELESWGPRKKGRNERWHHLHYQYRLHSPPIAPARPKLMYPAQY